MDLPTTSDATERRLHFYGSGDLATYWQLARAAEIIRGFDIASTPDDVNGILELHNERLFVEAGLVPDGNSGEAERTALLAAAQQIRRVVARWFGALTVENLAERLRPVDRQYHAHLLDLLAGLGVFGRFSAPAMLTSLDSARIHIGEMLTCKRLVQEYDTSIRDRIQTEPHAPELVIQHHLGAEARKETFLPASFTPGDSRDLMDAYIAGPNPNPNYLKLVANAPIESKTGVDAKLLVAASRRYGAMVESFFEATPGIETGCIVSLSPTQVEQVKGSLNDMVIEYTYSRAWLEDTLDFPSVLNNFQFLFEFAPRDGLLTLPSFDGERRGLERVFGVRGVKEYPTGHVFTAKDRATLLQTAMYHRFLASNDVDLEEVLRWYFEEHLPAEYGVTGFMFNPSSKTANHLERCRSLFAEMESVASQFAMLVEDGQIDHDVAAAGADLVRYRSIPSSLEGKYVYAAGDGQIRTILHILFSDQSHLTYVDEEVSAETAVELLARHRVSYESFHEYQRPIVDRLIEFGIAENTGKRIQLKDPDLFRVLESLNDFETVAYHHLSQGSRVQVDKMVDAGWLERRAALLTEPEAAYFNFYLNSVDFSNGPKLRNKYQHGSQPKSNAVAQHEQTYYTALRLMVALTIKMNDDFWLIAASK